jgi:hypothetical protein
MNLVDRNGTPHNGDVSHDEKGKPFFTRQESCHRCGGAGGADRWKFTGWTCFECSGTGLGSVRQVKLYTVEQHGKLEARAKKMEAKRVAKWEAERAVRLAPLNAWLEANAHLVAQIRAGLPAIMDEQSGERVHVYGSLIEKFESAINAAKIPADWLVNACIEKIIREGAQADLRAASRHVGQIGKRVEMELTCERLLDFPAEWPRTTFYVAIMVDECGNRIVYKGGNPPLGSGQTGRFKVTIKDHDERNGEAQTIVARPKVIEMLESEGVQS